MIKAAVVLKILMVCMLLATFTSCGTKSRVITTKEAQSKVIRNERKPATRPNTTAPRIADNIIDHAKEFEGTRYKYGGTTRDGMDCSGLVYVSFLEEGVSLPRNSRAMSLQGERLYLNEVNSGDLLFFETDKNKKVINHVGLVVEVAGDAIYFIHSSTSRGVIISSLQEPYWNESFVMARRVI